MVYEYKLAQLKHVDRDFQMNMFHKFEIVNDLSSLFRWHLKYMC